MPRVFPKGGTLEKQSYKKQKSCTRRVMKASLPNHNHKRQVIRIAVIETDPLRFAGLHTLLNSASDLELTFTSLSEMGARQNIDLALLGNHIGPNLFEAMATLRAARPDLRVIVMGSGMDEENILKAIAGGAKGYIDEAADPSEFINAIRAVNHGSVWAPRRVLSLFIERVSNSPGRIFPAGRVTFTDREKEVLEMLVPGPSTKEIGAPLGITERTVKAHVAKLMRKLGE